MRIAIAGATGQVGRELGIAARRAGHDVVELSRAAGVDLITGSDAELDRVLAGAEVVVDVTNSPTIEQDGATTFFETVAERLGAAATRAGVTRTVLLSIIGVDRTPEDGYFVAKLAHERATRVHAPGVRVLRAAQFHEFAEQSLGWGCHDGVVTVPDMPVQPVALSEVVRVLLELATAVEPVEPAPTVELASPRREQLAELVARLVRARGERVPVEPAPVSTAVRDGGLLPGPDAIIAGPDFAGWLAERP
jgi:uncharacterized protein YbjT (DUF2867 family)